MAATQVNPFDWMINSMSLSQTLREPGQPRHLSSGIRETAHEFVWSIPVLLLRKWNTREAVMRISQTAADTSQIVTERK